MEIKALLSRYRFSRNPNTKASVFELPPSREPEPIDLSSSEWERVEERIGQFLDELKSKSVSHYEAIDRNDALPLYFDWSGFMALRPDGQIVWIPYDGEPGQIQVVREERTRNLARFQATLLHP